ncbi:MAG: TonB-dependent receptor [Pseudomonadales bacterium]
MPELTGDDLLAETNGLNNEGFDHQAGYLNISWDVTDWMTIKYIGAYTDYLYTRVTDDDRSSNDLDMQFHANQENENFQHELQAFIDIGDDITLTTGLFHYENQIDQRLDFWSTGMQRYNSPATYPTFGFSPVPGNRYFDWQTARTVFATSAAELGTDPVVPLAMDQVGWASARDACQGNPINTIFNSTTFGTDGTVPDITGAIPVAAFSDPSITALCFLEGPWNGDTPGFGLGNAPSGPASDGTSFIWNTENQTTAQAAYAQAEWQINELFALTVGVRWAEDDKKGFENLYLYQEEALDSANLFAYNVAIGALNPDGTPTDAAPIRFRGIPFSQSIYRAVENKFDEVTYRVNLDWTPNADTLVYLSNTTGYRGGGFNLGYFSGTPTYEPETIDAYELGYKGQLLEGTLQINASVYHYTYENVHVQFSGNSFIGPSTVVRGHPKAVNQGFEFEGLWLLTDELTLGANYSYTDAKYDAELVDTETGSLGIVDTNNPLAPESLYSPAERVNLTNGARLQRIPEQKWAGYANYRWDIASGTIDFLTSVAWTDEISFHLVDSPIDTASDWSRWDARVTWTATDQRLSVAAFVNNITDEIGIRNMDREGEAENYLRSVVPTLPRMGGVEFRYRLGGY